MTVVNNAINVPIPFVPSKGGTGDTTLTTNGILIGNGTSNVSAIAPGASGTIVIGNGTSSAPSFSATPSGLTSLGVGSFSLSGTTVSVTGSNTSIVLSATGTGAVQLKNSSTVTPLHFYNAAGTFYSAFQAGSNTANVTWTLPTTDGTNGQVLSTNGSGVLSWVTRL